MAATITSRPNVPEEVIIGTQIWMKRNYDFGGTFPDNVYDNINDYGKLYTWAEAMAINLPGWHLPTQAEWETLYFYIGSNSGGKLKEAGTTHWLTPNTGADNSSGFTAVGSGFNEEFFQEIVYMWSSTESDLSSAYIVTLRYDNDLFGTGTASKNTRCSIRLIKDVPQALELTFNNIINVPVADASSVDDWNTFFDLPTYGTPFTSVVVDGDTVKLYGGSGIKIKDDLFYLGDTGIGSPIANNTLLSLNDNANCVTEVGYRSFSGCQKGTGLLSVDLPNVTIIGELAFWECWLKEISFPKAVTIGVSAFASNPSCTIINLPLVETVGNTAFIYCIGDFTNIDIQSCTSLGENTGLNNVFFGITGNTFTITVPTALMTCNSGNPDGDIAYLQANNTVTIITV